ncbi:MAG: hydrogenase [Desulfobulbaceae bacterium]|jgi:hydrogenase-4 component F|nr:hydrogenase [Desulfobulbaceae bacterium]
MFLSLLLLLPLALGLCAFGVSPHSGRILLVSGGAAQLALTLLVWPGGKDLTMRGFFAPAPAGMLVLLVIVFIFFFISCYAVFSMRAAKEADEPIFHGCALIFLGLMTMAALADHPIVLWIAIEATTLASAPLIFLHRSKEALEATWKYVLICSVGIALALLGFFFLSLSLERADLALPLSFSTLATVAPLLDPLWLKAAFLFVLIGMGTKMGLAPMHTWLPDAHSEAPSPASALLSGALLNCAFLAIYHLHHLMRLAGMGDFSGSLLIIFGLFSIFVAGIFLLNQPDYKRMLAYSSVENMGVIALGVGIGGLGVYGAMLHLLHHSLIKSSLFLSSGNMYLGFASKLIAQSNGMSRLLPKTFVTFFAGFLALTGLPPFGLFISELLIMLAAFRERHIVAAVLLVAGLALVITGLTRNVLALSFAPPTRQQPLVAEEMPRILPPAILLLASVALCIWLPPPLREVIIQAVTLLGGVIHG